MLSTRINFKIIELFIKDLSNLRNRNVEDLSGGELQRFACAVSCIRNSDIFMFDEPSSYLDVKQRLKAASAIRQLIRNDRYIILVEHDLSVLDYLSDFICCLYGSPGHYGVVTMPFSVREGINIFLDGFVPTENLRFRETVLTFKVSENANEDEHKKMCNYDYPDMEKSLGDFELTVKGGSFSDSEIVVLLGENGTGKSTLIRMLAGNLEPNNGSKKLINILLALENFNKINIFLKNLIFQSKFLNSTSHTNHRRSVLNFRAPSNNSSACVSETHSSILNSTLTSSSHCRSRTLLTKRWSTYLVVSFSELLSHSAWANRLMSI